MYYHVPGGTILPPNGMIVADGNITFVSKFRFSLTGGVPVFSSQADFKKCNPNKRKTTFVSFGQRRMRFCLEAFSSGKGRFLCLTNYNS